MSICAISIMTILFLCETYAFARNTIATSIAVDENIEPQIRLNFNISIMDLHCDYVSVDVWDALGTNRQNVTRNIDKWELDEYGSKKVFSGRNRDQRELEWEEHDMTLEQMHEEKGVHAIDVTASTYHDFLKENDFTFIDFFAPW